jgi:hypothetical protein
MRRSSSPDFSAGSCKISGMKRALGLFTLCSLSEAYLQMMISLPSVTYRDGACSEVVSKLAVAKRILNRAYSCRFMSQRFLETGYPSAKDLPT